MNKKRTFTTSDMLGTAIVILVIMLIAKWLGFIEFAIDAAGGFGACIAFAVIIALTGDKLDGSE